MLSYYHKPLISLFKDLNALKSNPKDASLCFSIQERLLDYIRRIEYRIRRIKSQNKIINCQIRNGHLPKNEVKDLRAQFSLNALKEQSYEELLLIFRDIGDGIAFIYLNKWDIKPLCMSKEQAGFISKKKGIRLELKVFRHCKLSNLICIVNDITNSIRHGDITIPMHGMPNIVELKSGRSSKNSPRAQRQKTRIENIFKYLKANKAQGVYPEQPEVTMNRCELLIKEKDHVKKLNSHLAKAIQYKQNVFMKIEKGLYYSIFSNESSIDETLKKLPKNRKWYISFVNQEKYIKQGYRPFTLLISDPEILFKFYNGDYLIVILIDLNVISQKFQKYSYIVEFLENPFYFFNLKSITSDFSMTISKHFFGRIIAEFLSLNWFIDEVLAQSNAPCGCLLQHAPMGHKTEKPSPPIAATAR